MAYCLLCINDEVDGTCFIMMMQTTMFKTS